MMKEDAHKWLGLRIQSYRKYRGVPQDEFAEKLGIKVTYLSRIENGKTPYSMSVDLLMDICMLLEVTPSELMEGVMKKEIEAAEKVKKMRMRRQINSEKLSCKKNKRKKDHTGDAGCTNYNN